MKRNRAKILPGKQVDGDPPEYRPTPEQRQRAMRQLHRSPYFTGWTSQEPLLKDRGNWRGERPK
jgi:hypothetical protein